MFFFDLLFVLFFAVLLSWLLVGGFGWRHPAREDTGVAVLFLFLVLFFTMWAGGAWLPACGPLLWGCSWSSFLLVGLLVALLLGATVPARKPKTRREAVQQAEEVAEVGVVFSGFFWTLVIFLIAAVFVRYAR